MLLKAYIVGLFINMSLAFTTYYFGYIEASYTSMFFCGVGVALIFKEFKKTQEN